MHQAKQDMAVRLFLDGKEVQLSKSYNSRGRELEHCFWPGGIPFLLFLWHVESRVLDVIIGLGSFSQLEQQSYGNAPRTRGLCKLESLQLLAFDSSPHKGLARRAGYRTKRGLQLIMAVKSKFKLQRVGW